MTYLPVLKFDILFPQQLLLAVDSLLISQSIPADRLTLISSESSLTVRHHRLALEPQIHTRTHPPMFFLSYPHPTTMIIIIIDSFERRM